MKYLVTGATGFLGANLARALLAAGHDVVAIVRQPNRLTAGLPITLVTPALDDLDALTAAAAGCDGIFHLAGTFDPGPGGEARMRALHVDATRTLLEVARRRSARMVTCSSSITVGYGSLESPGDEDTPIDVDRVYGRSGPLRTYHDSKRLSEQLTADAGGIVVCPDYVLGAWDVKPTSGQLLLTIARGWIPVYPTGGKCFIDAEDCAVGHLLAMERGAPGRRYLLGNHNLSYRTFMGACARLAHRPGPLLPLPSLVARAAGVTGRALQRFDPHRFAGLDPDVLLAMQQARYRSGRRAWSELGVPRRPIEVSIEAALAWFRAHGYV